MDRHGDHRRQDELHRQRDSERRPVGNGRNQGHDQQEVHSTSAARSLSEVDRVLGVGLAGEPGQLESQEHRVGGRSQGSRHQDAVTRLAKDVARQLDARGGVRPQRGEQPGGKSLFIAYSPPKLDLG